MCVCDELCLFVNGFVCNLMTNYLCNNDKLFVLFNI